MTAVEDGRVDPGEAIFAGGCFWCMESTFASEPGVIEVVSGYTGGAVPNPSYEHVCSGATGHFEAIRVRYDPARIMYELLLDVFWRHVDPTDPGGQFHDRGPQYRTAIFYLDDAQKALAEASKKRLNDARIFGKPIVTQILPAQAFYPAEEYHQDYHRRNAVRFSAYSAATGRQAFLDRTWKGADDFVLFPGHDKPWEQFERPSPEELRVRLTPLQYHVTQEGGTERAFQNEYWDSHEQGIYVDVVSGEPLFSSKDKFDSGSGWPSFAKPIEADSVVRRVDTSLFPPRVEARSRYGDSHLGHVFNDGPPPTRTRYCINSAALRFVPVDEMEENGYGEYVTAVR